MACWRVIWFADKGSAAEQSLLPGFWRIPDFCPVNAIFMTDPSVRRWKKHLAMNSQDSDEWNQWIIWFSMRRDLVIRWWWWWWREYDGICWVYGNSDSTNAASMSQNGFWRFGTLRHCNVHLTEISKPKLSHCIPSSLFQSAYQSTGSGKQFHWHYCHVWHCLLWEVAFTMRWCKIHV